jgi:regulator of protease activity HflC (stomatin/prohibitin superfamily)
VLIKDLVFPGNLQEIMNRILATERLSQAQLVEARTKAEVQGIEAQARAQTQRLESETRAESAKLAAQSEAETQKVKTEAEVQALRERELAAKAYSAHPALLRLQELETLRELARTRNSSTLHWVRQTRFARFT